MEVEPLYDRVIVKRKEASEKTKGGIIIPDVAKNKAVEGIVVAVGEGRIDADGKRVPPALKAGDKVLVGKFIGIEVRYDYKGKEQDMVIMTEDEILGKIKG